MEIADLISDGVVRGRGEPALADLGADALPGADTVGGDGGKPW
ncbi:hypothetical protein [Saccharopolyspora sp. ASAGF58]|nr:hypothetical protein [Saccharopolyspora sp. ASAGF58]